MSGLIRGGSELNSDRYDSQACKRLALGIALKAIADHVAERDSSALLFFNEVLGQMALQFLGKNRDDIPAAVKRLEGGEVDLRGWAKRW